ncbi:unnamed protein product, partial [Ixodes hexagonus]
APAFLREPPGQVVFSNATGALVSCSASGDPRPVLSWTNESGSMLGPVPGLRRTRPDGALEFFPFRGEDYRQDVHAAVYRCRAANALGTISSRNVHIKAGDLLYTGKARQFDDGAIGCPAARIGARGTGSTEPFLGEPGRERTISGGRSPIHRRAEELERGDVALLFP